MKFESTTADRVTAIVLFVLGLAMFWGGIDMDRLEFRRIHPASIPGLVPIILGAILMLCSILLARSKPPQSDNVSDAQSEPAESADAEPADTGNWGSFAFVAIWSSIFALFMVGNLPFAAASAIYIAVFSVWFLWPQQDTLKQRAVMIGLVVLFAGVTALGISILFQDGFLVRLP